MRLSRILLGAIVVAASVIYAYVQMFSQLRFYDDEGFLMALLESFIDGATLYDQTPTFYGPFYYLVAKFLYFLADVPISHDATRLATIVFWLGTAALAAGLVYRLTSSFVFTSVAYLQTVVHGWSLCNEPGHPQTLLVFLGMAVPFASAVLAPGRAGGAFLGILAACITLTKINLGVYTLVALMLAYLSVSVPTRLVRAGFFASSVVAVALPFVLMRSHLSEWALNYALTSALTIAACCVTVGRANITNPLQKSALWIFIASGITAAVVVVSVMLLAGTSLNALVTETLFEPVRFPALFVFEWRVSAVAVVIGAVSLALAAAAARLEASRRAALAIWVKLALGTGVAVALLLDRSALISIAPLIWVTLIAPREEPSRLNTLFPRAVVCVLAAMYLLIAYPVTGSQQDWATALLIPATILNLADAWSVLALRVNSGVRLATQAALLAVVVLAYSTIFDPVALFDKYRALSPLDLRGATRIRLDAQNVLVYQDLVKSIDGNCETFATVPNFLSLHFWTTKAPAGELNTVAWMVLIDDDTQRRLVSRYMPWPRIPKDLAAHSAACVVYNQSAATRWASLSSIDDGALISYIRESFRTVRTIGDYELMMRNDGRLPD